MYLREALAGALPRLVFFLSTEERAQSVSVTTLYLSGMTGLSKWLAGSDISRIKQGAKYNSGVVYGIVGTFGKGGPADSGLPTEPDFVRVPTGPKSLSLGAS